MTIPTETSPKIGNDVVAYQLRHMENSVADVKKDIQKLDDKIERLFDNPRWISLEGFNREMRVITAEIVAIKVNCDKEIKELNDRLDKNAANLRNLAITFFTAFVAPILIILITYLTGK